MSIQNTNIYFGNKSSIRHRLDSGSSKIISSAFRKACDLKNEKVAVTANAKKQAQRKKALDELQAQEIDLLENFRKTHNMPNATEADMNRILRKEADVRIKKEIKQSSNFCAKIKGFILDLLGWY